MVIKKTLGYVLGLLGVLGIAMWAIPGFRSAVPQLSDVTDTILVAVSVVLAAIGIFLITKGGGGRGKMREVPIFQGKDVVGYRRQGK
ncbi:MAG: hypothetical protein ABH864_05500 [archaeon]